MMLQQKKEEKKPFAFRGDPATYVRFMLAVFFLCVNASHALSAKEPFVLWCATPPLAPIPTTRSAAALEGSLADQTLLTHSRSFAGGSHRRANVLRGSRTIAHTS